MTIRSREATTMAKKKPADTRRRKTPIKDLPSPAGGAEKVKGGALLLSTQQLQASRSWTDGNSQPPQILRK
jgi:hypothetical protein